MQRHSKAEIPKLACSGQCGSPQVSNTVDNCACVFIASFESRCSLLASCVLFISAILLLEVMATPTSIILDDEVCEEGVFAKSPNKRSEYGKVLAVSLCTVIVI